MKEEEVDDQERKKLFAELKADLFKCQLSNSDNLDKAVLTYSSAGLALSLGLLKELIPLAHATYKGLLFTSWILFVVAIIVTIASFLTSQCSVTKQLRLGERYYLKKDESAFLEKNGYAIATKGMSFIAGSSFVVAVIFTTLFVYFNV